MDPDLQTRPREDSALAYESSIGGALEAGERVLWEGRPDTPAQPSPWAQRWIALVALISIPLATAMIASEGSRSDWLTIAVPSVVVGVLTAWVMADSARRARRKKIPTVVYRVTDRRAIRADDRPGKPHRQAELATLRGFSMVQGRRAEISIDFDAVAFTHLTETRELDTIARLLLERWAKSGRRRKVRRTPVTQELVARPRGDDGDDDGAAGLPPLPAGIVLAEDERVLWAGRPRVKDPIDRAWVVKKLGLVAWLMIPAALLVLASGVLAWAPRAHWAVGIFAALWIVLGLYGLTIEPLRQSQRRARTIFVLTNVRAIVHESGAAARTTSHLLDMVERVNVARRGNGAADV